MKEFKTIQIFFYVTFSLWTFSLGSQVKPDQQVSDLTLQWEASHPTGEHQISLVFKPDRVDLFTSTSLWQGEISPRLGHFTAVLSEDWKAERNRIDSYRAWLKEYSPDDLDQFLLRENFPEELIELIKDSPHAPVVKLNEYKVGEEDPIFPALEGVFPLVWEKEKQWTCVDCVIYRIHRKKIERRRISKDGTTVKRVFSRKQLNCYSINEKILECTDTRGGPTGNGWGSFRISL